MTCAQNDPSLPVYVLGVGQQLQNLAQIAQAGGTERAYLVEGGDVTAQVLTALNAIRGNAAIPCQLRVPSAPAGQQLDLTRVNVSYCNGARESQTFFYVGNQGACDAQRGGWYFDDPASPQQILLCDTSCNTVSQPGGSLVTTLGCGRVEIPR
jgi:hypothetical protein